MAAVRDIYAYVGEDSSGQEGILWIHTQAGATALVAADPTLIPFLRNKAEEIATIRGKAVRLVRFAVAEEMEIVKPPRAQG